MQCRQATTKGSQRKKDEPHINRDLVDVFCCEDELDKPLNSHTLAERRRGTAALDEADQRDGRNTEVPATSSQISGPLHSGPPPKTAASRGRTIDGGLYLTSTPNRALKQLLLEKPNNNSLALHVTSPLSRAHHRTPIANDSWVKRYKYRRNERLTSDPALRGSKKTPQPKPTANALA